MIKIEIKSIFGKVLYTHESENNTVKETVERANLEGANLEGANLYGANLYEANLEGANLYEANLKGANLYEANLVGANLEGANLERAKLHGANLELANLYGANLKGANLYEAKLEGANLERAKLPIYQKWSITHSHDYKTIYIGCKSNTIEGWDSFFNSTDEFETKRDTPEFKRIQASYESMKAYIIFLSKNL